MERMTVDETNLRGILEQCGGDYCKKINGDCSKCSFLDISLEKLRNYEKAEQNGMLKHLPCRVGDTVYVLWECGRISPQLDGTLYGENGGPGTATGYYCPYEDNCPHADYSCEECESKTAVFEDTVVAIWLTEEGIFVNTENCGACSALGEICFLTREAAEQALAKMKGV